MPLPTDRFRGSVPIRGAEPAPVDRSGEIIGEAVEKFATDMANLAYSKAKDKAIAQGSIDGARAGVARDETGRLIAPDLTDIDPTTFYGASYLDKTSEVFSQSVRNDARKEADRIAAEHPSDVTKYDAAFAAYRDTVLENVPPELMPKTITDIDSIHASKRAGVLAAQSQFAAQALIDEHNADQAGIEQQLTDHIQSGANDPLMADYLVGQYNENNQRMVKARMMTQAEALENERKLVERMDTELFATRGRSHLINGDIDGFAKLQEEIQFNADLPESVRANALNTLSAELNQWAQRDNRKKAKEKAALTLAHQQGATAETRRIVGGGDLLTPEEYLDGVDRGKWSRAFGEKMALKSFGDAQEKISDQHRRIVAVAILNVENGQAANVHPDIQALFNNEEAKKYATVMSAKLEKQIKNQKAMTTHDLKTAVTLYPMEYNYTALREELFGRVDRDEMDAGDASAILKAHVDAMKALNKSQAPLRSGEVKLEYGHPLNATELKAREDADPDAYNPLNMEQHDFIVQDAIRTKALTPGVARFLKSLPVQSGDNLQIGFDLVNKFLQSDTGSWYVDDALGSDFGPVQDAAIHFSATGDLQGAHKVLVDASKGDNSASDRRLSAVVSRDETAQERLDFYRDAGNNAYAKELGWFDDITGWLFDVNHDPELNADVNEFLKRGVSLDDFSLSGEALHWVADEADRILSAASPITRDRTRAAEIAAHRAAQIFSPVQIEDGTFEWRRGDISKFAVNDPGTPTILKDRWSPKVPYEDFRLRATAHGINSPTGAGWSNEILDFRVIPGTEGKPRPTYVVWYKEGDQWSPLHALLDDGTLAPVHYQWDYETSGVKAMIDYHVDKAQNGTLWERYSAWVRGDEEGWFGIIDSGPVQHAQEFIAAGEAVESSEYWRDVFNYIHMGDLLFAPQERRQIINDQLGLVGKPKKVTSGIIDEYKGVNINFIRRDK